MNLQLPTWNIKLFWFVLSPGFFRSSRHRQHKPFLTAQRWGPRSQVPHDRGFQGKLSSPRSQEGRSHDAPAAALAPTGGRTRCEPRLPPPPPENFTHRAARPNAPGPHLRRRLRVPVNVPVREPAEETQRRQEATWAGGREGRGEAGGRGGGC